MPKTYGTISNDKNEDVFLVNMDGFIPTNPFNESFNDPNFWDEVKDVYEQSEEVSRAAAQRIVRVKWLRKERKESATEGEISNVLVHLLTTCFDRYKQYCEQNKDQIENPLETLPTFVFEINEFAKFILAEDAAKEEDREYEDLLDMPNGELKSVLHLAAERDLHEVAQIAIDHYPSLVNVTTYMKIGDEDEEDDQYPLSLALVHQYDRTASVLIKAMENEKVRSLFQHSVEAPARYFFKDYIQHPDMKKTVLALLDCQLNPDWPFISRNDDDTLDAQMSVYDNIPLRYHFYYRMLDGDERGRTPKLDTGGRNPDFNWKSKSCLQLIAESTSKEEAMLHPVVRLLVRRKWDKYGWKHIVSHFIMYIVFLVVFSCALFLHNKTQDPNSYQSPVDYLRAVCEAMTLVFTFFYLVSEVDQWCKEGRRYFVQFFNWVDVISMLLIVALIPLRLLDATQTEWAVASLAFLLNVIRVIKYFPGYKPLGLYVKTFESIIKEDISKFAVIYFISMFAFTGSVYMALLSTGLAKQKGGFWGVLLSEIRALTESNGFADDYDAYKTLVIVLIMLNMFSIMVVLVNILIGQISTRYTNAMENATVQYDLDRTKLVTKIENSNIFPWNQRFTYYVEGAYVSNDDIESELIDDWALLKKTENSRERKVEGIKTLMNTRVKRLKLE